MRRSAITSNAGRRFSAIRPECGMYSWGAARMMRRVLPSRPVMGAIFGIGGMLLLPVLLLTGAPIVASWHNFAAVAYLAAVPMFVGYVLFGRGLAAVPASTAITLSLLE